MKVSRVIKEKVRKILKEKGDAIAGGVKPIERINLEEKKLINKWLEKLYELMEDSYDDMIGFSNKISIINDIFRRAVEEDNTYENDLKFCEENVSVLGDYQQYDKELLEKFREINVEIIGEFKVLENDLALLYYIVQSKKEWDECCNRFKMFRIKFTNTLIEEATKIFNSFTKENNDLMVEWQGNFKKLSDKVEKEEAIKKLAKEDNIEEKIKLNYMASYREIEMLAKENGFEFIGVGRHHNFVNDDGKKVPIPKHSKDLGKGISLKIQKEILEGKR